MLITQRSVVRVHAGPLDLLPTIVYGAVAQLGERLICIQEVAGSIPVSSTAQKICFLTIWKLERLNHPVR